MENTSENVQDEHHRACERNNPHDNTANADFKLLDDGWSLYETHAIAGRMLFVLILCCMFYSGTPYGHICHRA